MKYVFFDLDGTVADTKMGVTKSVQYSLRKFGINEENLDDLEKFIGPPLHQSYKDFYGFSEEKSLEAVKEYRVYYGETGVLECYIYEGIYELIKKLHENGIKVLLATSKPEVYAKKILEHFNLAKYFDVIAGSTMTKERTSKVDVLKYAISQLDDFEPSNAYMIGDRKFDYIGANELGIPCILIGYGYGSMEELIGCKPYRLKRTVEDLSDFLLGEIKKENKSGSYMTSKEISEKAKDAWKENAELIDVGFDNNTAARMVSEFDDTFSGYYEGNVKDEEIIDQVTQPFYYSILLNKRRLDNKGLVLTRKYVNSQSARGAANRLVTSEKEGGINVKNYERKILVERKFVKGSQVICKKRENLINLSGVLKVIGDGESAVCINCGNINKISTYLNGCDYCGTKYKVNNFEKKISYYSETQNLSSGKSVMEILLPSLIIAALSIPMMAVFNDTKAVFDYLKALIIIYMSVGLITVGIMISKPAERLVKNSMYFVIKNKINGFSPENFAQMLEYKIRTLCFADTTKEVNTFGYMDFDNVVKKYKDAVACNMTRLCFTDFKEEEDSFILTAEVDLIVSEYNGKKINNYEEIATIKLKCKKTVSNKTDKALIGVICQNCGSSIDMLKGGKCSYCDNIVDYSDYDWMICDYESEKTNRDKKPRRIAKLILVGGVVAAFVIFLCV